MATITKGRTARGAKTARIRKVGKKAALMGAAAATAATMAMGTTTAPEANALPALDATTTGPLFWLLNQAGVDTVTLPVGPPLGDVTVNLGYVPSDPVDIYDAINANVFGGWTIGLNSFYRPNVFSTTSTGPLMLAMGVATPDAIEAYQALLASAQGNTPEGYTPLTAAGLHNTITGASCATPSAFCQQATNVTNLPAVLINNLGTPNGGIEARFQQIYNLFGIDPVSPNAQTGSSTGIRLATALINVALGYNMQADFPATANLFALANSLMATALPTYLLGGGELKGAGETAIINQIVNLLNPLNGSSSTSYTTFAPTDLPLLEALRLPSRIIKLISTALGHPIDLPTPIADALQPALEILVNIGYTDVQTPSEGGTYNRTYDLSNVNTPWLSENPLTPAEWAQVPGDVVRALVSGIVGEIHTIFGGAAAVAAPPAAALVAAESTDGSPAPDVQATSGDSDDSAGAADATDATPSLAGTRGSGRHSAGGSAKPSKKSAASAHGSGASASSDGAGAPHRGVGGPKRVRANSDAA